MSSPASWSATTAAPRPSPPSSTGPRSGAPSRSAGRPGPARGRSAGGPRWSRGGTGGPAPAPDPPGEPARVRGVDGVTGAVPGSAGDDELETVAAAVKPYSG